MAARLKRIVVRAFGALAVAYPLALISAWLMLRFVGERWWVTGVLLFLPPQGWLLPLPCVLLPLLVLRRWRLALLQLVSLALVLFPLMGLTLSVPRGATGQGPKLRVLSYNLNSGRGGIRPTIAEIESKNADLLFLHELPDSDEMIEELRPRYSHIERSTEFVVASRFPIVSTALPSRIPFFGVARSPRFWKVVVDTSLGKITFFHVHTISPRSGLYELRGKQGLRREITSGRLLSGANADSLQRLAALRELQIEALAKLAALESGPVVIVGDTNLPELSPVRHRLLGHFQDGFERVGTGFGYTFPSDRPWMRIDLVLASEELRFEQFQVGDQVLSDHFSVVAQLVPAVP